MELSGQSGSNSAAQVTDEAVEECEDLSRIFSPTSAPLIHQPENGQRGLNAIEAFAMNCWNKCWQQKTKEKKKSTHRKQESSKNSVDSELRPMGTQSLSASREKQVETESAQNSTRLERKASGSPLVGARPRILAVNLFAFRVTGENKSMGPTCKLASRADGAEPRGESSAYFLGEERTCDTPDDISHHL